MKELSNKNRPKSLEEVFREGMEEAEMAPSELLWSRIDRDLNIKENGYYKKRVVWYQRLAAACVVLVLFAGAYLFFDVRQDHIIAAKVSPKKSMVATTPSAKPFNDQAAPVSRQSPLPADKVISSGGSPVVGGFSQQVQTPRLETSNSTDIAGKPAGSTAIAQSALEKNISLPSSQGKEDLLAGEQSAIRELTQSGTALNSLSPVLTWPGMGRLAALQNPFPAGNLVLTAVPPIIEPSKADAEQAGSRWRFGGKYASQYFDQNIALTYKQSRVASSALAPGAMLPFASAGASSYSDALKEFDKETGSGFSFNTGISAAYQISKHLDLETGLGYTQNVATTNTSYIFNNAQIGSRYSANFYWNDGAEMLKNSPVATGIPSTAFLATLSGGSTLNQTAVTKTQAFDTQYRYRLLGIPVKISYQTNRSKSFYFASMGMLTNLLVQANILSDSDRVPDLQYAPNAKESPFRNWHFAAVASAGKGFEIMPGLQIKAGLEATQYLTNLTVHPDFLNGKQRKPYTIGLALSSGYTFGK